MASNRRVDRLNSLLREVISEVIHRDWSECDRYQFASIGNVEVARDLHHAKVYIGFCSGTETERSALMAFLQENAGPIASMASRKVRLRFFPSLTFLPDHSVERHQEIGKVMDEVAQERAEREGE